MLLLALRRQNLTRVIVSIWNPFQVWVADAPAALVNHVSTGPIQQFAALRIRAENDDLPWTRDPVEISTIHVEVPTNTDSVSVDFDTLVENTISDHQLLLAWNTVLLCPRGIDKTKLMIQPSVLLPSNWKQASSLEVIAESGSRVNFASISLERMIVFAGNPERIRQCEGARVYCKFLVHERNFSCG
jgi:Peptidase M61 N-terminal domain